MTTGEGVWRNEMEDENKESDEKKEIMLGAQNDNT